MSDSTYPRQFLPADFTASSFEAIEKIYKGLLERDLSTKDLLEQWCRDWSEVDSVIAEESSRRYVKNTCFTEDPDVKARFMEWLKDIAPGLKKISFDMDRKFIDSPALSELDTAEFGMWIQSVRNSVELFREENIPLQTEEKELDAKYDEVIGAMTVEFDGETRTLPYMGRILEETDRDRREQAFRAVNDRILQDQDQIQTIFDRQLDLRQQMAVNCGLDNYRSLRFRQLERFDYGPEECLQFHESIEKVVMPLIKDRLERRREQMGLEKLRPWDTAVDPMGR
ncbi:MAG: M3 family oligoendopeptidase, partial [Proteobacteria bacterium]|nr:M3 family oligoendopeptidase [Pseudomonadota bacterium]